MRENRYKHLETRNKVLIGLMIYQGLTSDELTRLTIANIDLDKGTVYIKGSKNLAQRELELKSPQTLMLYKYINEDRPHLLKSTTDKLLVGTRGVGISTDAIHSMVEQLKSLFPDTRLSPQTIRQSVICNWLNKDKIAIEHVQQMAGHKYPSSTMKYQKKDADEQRKLINKFHPLN